MFNRVLSGLKGNLVTHIRANREIDAIWKILQNGNIALVRQSGKQCNRDNEDNREPTAIGNFRINRDLEAVGNLSCNRD